MNIVESKKGVGTTIKILKRCWKELFCCPQDVLTFINYFI